MQASSIQRGATAAAIRDHYDLGNDFYALWLDPQLSYSAAMWSAGDDLATAQGRKLDYHIANAKAQGKSRVLDIGCGWGAMLRRLVERGGVEHATGLTLSVAQADHVSALGLPVDVHIQSWTEHEPRQPYDAIISVGAFEHFARIEFSELQKVEAYREFFERCHDFLVPDGHLSLQTFAYNGRRSRTSAATSEATKFLALEIFKETDPPRAANICEAIEGVFEITTWRNDRVDYAKTCRVWSENLKARRGEAIALVGAEAVERYERYLSYSYLGFMSGNLGLYRIGLRRIDRFRRAGTRGATV
jgi:cyclopropane-fatty-acyl-phospholipid synthase